MPVSSLQPVYPPPAGRAVEQPWGAAVSESVVQRFASQTERNARWTTPPTGAVCSTAADKFLWFYTGTAWTKIAQVTLDVTPVDTAKMDLAGGTFTGPVYTMSTLALRRVGDAPYIEWQRTTGVRMGYIQSNDAGNEMLYAVDSATDRHRFAVGGSTKLQLDTNSVDITSANLTVSGTAAVNGIFYGVSARFGGDGAQVNLIDTVSGGNDAYMNFYGSGTTTTPGTLNGRIGYIGTTMLQISNLLSAAPLRLLTTGAGDITLQTGAAGELLFYPNGVFQGKMAGVVFMWGKAASDLANAGMEMYGSGSGAEGSIRITTAAANIQNVYCRHISSSDSSGQAFIHFVRGNPGVTVGAINQNGTTGTTYSTTSDYRQKNDLGRVVNALDRLMQLMPKHLGWKDGSGEFDGFIAHEAQEVVPESVTGEKDALYSDEEAAALGVAPGSPKFQQFEKAALVPLIVAALQELTARVYAL